MRPVDHAMAALLWSSTDPETGEPLDNGDFRPSPNLWDRLTCDWQAFRESADALGFDAEEHCAQMLHPDCGGDAWAAAAHDFILTRNGHGTGFWEAGRWAEPYGEQLTALCRGIGELCCWVDADGFIQPEG